MNTTYNRYQQIFFLTQLRRQFNEERTVFFYNWSWNNWTSKGEKQTLTLTVHTYKTLLKMNHRCKCKTIQLLEENTWENLCDLWSGKMFLDMTPKTWFIKEKWINWTSSELKAFTLWKTVFWEWKIQVTYCEEILENHISCEGLWIARIYKELLKFNSKKTTQSKNGQKTWTNTSSVVSAWQFAKCFLGTNSEN